MLILFNSGFHLQLRFSHKLCYWEGIYSCMSHHSYFSDNFFTAKPELEADPLPWEAISNSEDHVYSHLIHKTLLSLIYMTIFHVQTLTHSQCVFWLWLRGISTLTIIHYPDVWLIQDPDQRIPNTKLKRRCWDFMVCCAFSVDNRAEKFFTCNQHVNLKYWINSSTAVFTAVCIPSDLYLIPGLGLEQSNSPVECYDAFNF